MPQITIYLDKETERKMRAFVRGKKVSRSQWVASLIREKLQSEWPEDVAALAGAWQDFPSLEEIRAGTAKDVSRETL